MTSEDMRNELRKLFITRMVAVTTDALITLEPFDNKL